MDVALARLAISLVDLTDLTDDCTDAAVDTLCQRALAAGTAAVCVWPDFVARSARAVAGSPVRVATVVDFPSGAERPFAVGVVTERALADGADEIDVVLPYGAFAAGHLDRPAAMLAQVRSLTEGRALMKVILETGELVDLDTVDRAARFAVEHGADFIKTSTGKVSPAATLPVTLCMLEVIRDVHDETGRLIGMKPAGGIRTAKQAIQYLCVLNETLGTTWMTPELFRFGASSLLNDVLMQIRKQHTGSYQSGDYFTID
jgi:deoxyribose-phosphate aldolase